MLLLVDVVLSDVDARFRLRFIAFVLVAALFADFCELSGFSQ